MASEELVRLTTATAGVDLSAASLQFTFVKLDANGNVVPCAALADVPFGVLYDTAKSGSAVPVAIFGLVKVKAGGTVAPGNQIATTAAGVAQVAAAASSQSVVGTARTSAVSGDIFTVWLDTAVPYVKP